MNTLKYSLNSQFPISVVILSLLLLCHCTTDQTKFVTKELTGRKIACDSLNIRSYPIALVGDTLISATYSRDDNCCVSVFRNDSLITIGSIFPIGNGEGESKYIKMSSNPDKGLNIIDAVGYGSILKSYQRYQMNHIIKPSSEQPIMRYDLPEMPPLRFVTDNFVNINDSVILITGSTYEEPSHIFSIIDLKSGDIQCLKFWPQDGYKGHPLPKQSVYTDNARLFNSRDRYLYVCGEERYSFIFMIRDRNIIVKKDLFYDLPEYEEASDGLNYNLKSRSIFRLQCDTNNENIYILLIEKNSAGDTAVNWTKSDSGNEVRVYDWEGNLQSVLKLDKVGSYIKVSDNNKILFLFSENPKNGDNEVYSYYIE